MTERKHHILIAGNVLFMHNTSQEMGSVPLNGVLVTNRKDMPAASLHKAQQVLQHNFHKASNNQGEVTVVDVVLQNLVYLGEFTEEEFQEPPAGMAKQEAVSQILDAMEIAAEAANG